jgi:D-3-phosphoglycerate dehydrogenase
LQDGLTDYLYESLDRDGYESLVKLETGMDEDTLTELLKDVNIIVSNTRFKYTKKVLDNAKNLIAIFALSVGTDHIDMKTATDNGVIVFNSPYGNTRSVAEYAIGTMFCLLRRFVSYNNNMQNGEWNLENIHNCLEAKGKTLGVIGYGNVGSQIAMMAESLNMDVIYWNRRRKLSPGSIQFVKKIDDLLKLSDVVILAVASVGDTQNLISERELKIMKRGSYLINVARGTVLNYDALADSLKNGHLAGAALDVFPNEPKANGAYKSVLAGLDNVILTPHIAWGTLEGADGVYEEIREKFMDFVADGTTISAMNIPEISCREKTEDNARIIYTYQDSIEVFTKIINSYMTMGIVFQSMKSNGKVGYIVLDVKKNDFDKKIYNEVMKIDGVLKGMIL